MKILKSKAELNALFSYAYILTDHKIVDCWIPLIQNGKRKSNILIDSGAFTAYNTGRKIDLQEYIKFIKHPPFKIWKYFTLDVIGNPKETWVNYQKMLDVGLHPIPIFTPGDTFDNLDKMYETSDIIGLGGLFGGMEGYVVECMKHIGKRKCHWLGYTRMRFLKHFKPFSCDSTAVVSGSRWGYIKLCDRAGKVYSVTRVDFLKKPSEKILRLIREYGFDPTLLTKKENWRRPTNPPDSGLMIYLGIMGVVRKGLLIQKHLGTKYFNVGSVDWQFICMAHDYWIEKGILK